MRQLPPLHSMKAHRAAIAIAAISVAAFSSCTESGYRKATVVKMAMIFEPDNLADDSECRELWGNISRYGMDMDTARKDWNQVILNSVSALIERGCVKQRVD